MASRSQVDQVRRALNSLSTQARRNFLQVWSRLDPNDWAATRKVLEQFWPDLIGHYGEMAAALAADQFTIEADALGVQGEPQMVRPVDPERANARMRWALGVPDQQGSLLVILDELVKQPYRSTLQRSAAKADVAWARVPTGGETCGFCLMLASRGAVYESADTAGRGRKYHGDCDCTPVLARGDADLPYDVEKLYDQYLDAREASGSGRTKEILAELRTQQNVH